MKLLSLFVRKSPQGAVQGSGLASALPAHRAIWSVALGLIALRGMASEIPPLDVMPMPLEARVAGGRIRTPPRLMIEFSHRAGHRLQRAADSAMLRWSARFGSRAPTATALVVVIACEGQAADLPTGSEDESYRIEVKSGSAAALTSPNDLGAIHGLETLLQLPRDEPGGSFLPLARIVDRPRFAWRGLLIDVCRHWEPYEVIQRNLDAMAVVKLNVLHLHLSDDQGFRIESKTHPELQQKGSDGCYFSQAQIRTLIAYAGERGIRIVPELDMPGHTESWLVSHPELASAPGPYAIARRWGVLNPVLDPTNEATYALIADLLGEMAELFPDRYFHIGGDENNGVQWTANRRIQDYIAKEGYKNNTGLHAYFNRRIHALLAKYGKRMIGWDEILNSQLPADCVIESWRGSDGIAEAQSLGFDAIRAHGYYIDLCGPAAEHYLEDPLPAARAKLAGSAQVLGGEATMWGEWVSPETIDSRIWPRTAAIAERFWSPAQIRDVPEMYRRLAVVSQRLDEAGSLHLRNRDVMLRHLVGPNLNVDGVAELRTFVALLEPVKGYLRFDSHQGEDAQLIPLVTLADAAIPDSAIARDFANQMEAALFRSPALDRGSLHQLKVVLADWKRVATKVGGTLSGSYRALEPAAPVAKRMGAACDVGLSALDALSSGGLIAASDAAKWRSSLAAIEASDTADFRIAIFPGLRLAIAAALSRAEGVSPGTEGWRKAVLETARHLAPAMQ